MGVVRCAPHSAARAGHPALRQWPAELQVAFGEPARGIEAGARHSPAGERRASDRPARERGSWSTTPTSACSPRFLRTRSSLARCASCTSLRWPTAVTVAPLCARRCAPTSPPVANISSAASALGRSRQPVRSRLHAIEETRSHVNELAPEIEVALRLESSGAHPGPEDRRNPAHVWRRRTLRGTASPVGQIALLSASLRPCPLRPALPSRPRGFRQSLLGGPSQFGCFSRRPLARSP